jgi:glycerol uptake facilitator-like aquaporin
MRAWTRYGVQSVSEFIGTGLFQIIGGGAMAASAAWANGLILSSLIYFSSTYGLSHLNPAVTVSMFVASRISLARACLFVAAQVAGAIVGAGLSRGLLIPKALQYPGCLYLTAHASTVQVASWEFFMTAILVSVVHSVAVSNKAFGNVGPLAIGLTLTACAFTGGPFTGAFLNPARVIGPAVIYGCWYRIAAYIVPQICAGVGAGLFSRFVNGPGNSTVIIELDDELDDGGHTSKVAAPTVESILLNDTAALNLRTLLLPARHPSELDEEAPRVVRPVRTSRIRAITDDAAGIV